MNKLKELRKKVRKNNKGFSLVELIVVIVILAILIGVTIGGIYQYVNNSRINTDISNAASIQSVLSTVATDADVNAKLKDSQNVVIIWKEAVTQANITTTAKSTSTTPASTEAISAVGTKVKDLLTDGLPAPKANGSFKIEIVKDGKGNITATCKAYEGTEGTGDLLKEQS